MLSQRFRIAPTPSGYLHLGNAFNFILTALLARTADASLRLRIDDADATRVRPEYLADIFEILNWLGIGWGEGPRDIQDHTTQFSQNLRTTRYDEVLQWLIATGQVFACDCSRKNILAISPDGQYPGTCRDRNLPLDIPGTALRLRTPRGALVHFMDVFLAAQTLHPYDIARDPVIRRRDDLPAYHIASLTDDLDFGVTQIVRGEDLLGSTAVQLFISQVLGGTALDRVTFYHHPLLKDSAGGKLSKSAGSNSLRAMRKEGTSATDVYRRFSMWMGWRRTAANLSEAAAIFAQHSLDALKQAAPLRDARQ